jgi:ATP-binding cassette subfamily F protein uup
VDEYLELRYASAGSATSKASSGKNSNAAEQRQLKKDLTRVERQIEKGRAEVSRLSAELEAGGSDSGRLIEITQQLTQASADLQSKEEEWLEITVKMEGE